MLLKNFLSNHQEWQHNFAVVDSTTNELLHTFKTDIVARAFSSSVPGSRVIWLSKRNITDVLNN